MTNTTNYGLKKPGEDDLYDIRDHNDNMDTLDTNLKSVSMVASGAASSIQSHAASTNNPHAVTKAQIGLSNVPNVSTNNQTPTYTVPSADAALTSGETLTTAFGKIAKAVSSLISHIANTSNPHSVTKAQVGLSNVPNVSTNDQTPTYSDTTTLATLSSGEKLNVSLQKIKYAITTLINHIGNKNNPHVVTKAQIGLGNVDNTSDANKPISTATQTALNAKQGTVTGAASSITSSNLSAGRTLISDTNGKVSTSPITAQTLTYIDGVTSNVQTQFNNIISSFARYENRGQLGAPQEITSSVNLNSFMTEGVYSFSQANTPTNVPDGVVNGWLIVFPWTKSITVACKQIIIRHGTITDTNWKIYVRTRIDSTWGSWGEVVTDKSNIAHCYTLCDNLIPEGSNLNNFKSIGTYRATGTNIAATMTNCPTQVNFRMDIEFTSSINYVCQKIVDRNAAVYIRVCDLTTGNWTAWKTL